MIESFISYLLTIKGYSQNTAESYRRDLTDFAHWAKGHIADARWSKIKRPHIDMYLQDMVSHKLKPSTTNRRLSAISSLYSYFKREGLTDENPAKYEGRRKITDTIPNTIPIAELQTAYEHSAGIVKEMLGLLISTGIRIQELLDLTYEDIDFATGRLRIHGKGKKERTVYTDKSTLQTLRELRDMGHTGIIFNLTQRDARRLIWDALRRYSQAPQLSPHAIRHTFATHLASQGTNCSTLSTILGHNNLNTTQKYIDMTQANIKNACLEYSLLN